MSFVAVLFILGLIAVFGVAQYYIEIRPALAEKIRQTINKGHDPYKHSRHEFACANCGELLLRKYSYGVGWVKTVAAKLQCRP